MRIVFFGSDDFAATCLRELLLSSHDVVGCVTQPDTRQGRGMKMALSPIKEIALEHDIVCLQPESLKTSDIVGKLQEFNADIFAVVAYGRILPQDVLDIPKVFCVNVHGSLLPQYRGAAPVNWTIINGDKQTGVSVQKMSLQLDAGEIILQETISLEADITSDVLRSQMAEVGAKLLVKSLDMIETGAYPLKEQDESKVTIAVKLTKEMGKIDWKKSADEIERLIRGLKPWPGTYTSYNGKTLKILEAVVFKVQGKPGEILEINKQGFVVACNQDALLVKRVHPEAGKALTAYDFVQGHRLKAKELLI